MSPPARVPGEPIRSTPDPAWLACGARLAALASALASATASATASALASALASATEDSSASSIVQLLRDASEQCIDSADSAGALLDALYSSFRRAPRLAVRAADAFAAWLQTQDATDTTRAFLLAGWMHGVRREESDALRCVRAGEARSAKPTGSQSSRVSAALVKGLAALAAGDHEAAAASLVVADDPEIGDAGRAEAALALAHLYAERGDIDSARERLESAAAHAAGDSWLAFRIRTEEADLRFHESDYARAEAAYDELESAAQSEGWPLEIAHLQVMRGLSAAQRGDVTVAEASLFAARSIYASEETAYYLGVCQRALGSLYRKMGRYQEALEAATDALTHFQRAGHRSAEGRCHHAIGLINYDWNRYDDALLAYQAAFEAYGAAHLRREQSAIRVNIALIYEAQGHYDAAYSSYERAAAEYRALRVPGDRAICLSNMADVRQRLGQHGSALSLYRQARRVLTRTGSRFDAAVVALGQSGSLQALGRSESARRLLLGCRRYFTAGHSPAQAALCELALGEDSALRGKPHAAISHFETARQLLSDAGQEMDVAFADLLVGEALLAAGVLAEARRRFEHASRSLEGGFPDMAARAEAGLGRIDSKLDDAPSAALHWQRAVDSLAAVRKRLATEDHGAGFFSVWRWVYDAAIDGWLAVERPDRVLALVEAAKGQVLASMLEQPEVVEGILEGEAPEVRALWDRSKEIASRLTSARPAWYVPGVRDAPSHLTLSDAGADPGGDRAQRQLVALLDEQALLFERVRRLRSSFDLIAPAAPFDIDAFRQAAERQLGTGWSALVYYLRESTLVILWLTAGGLRSWQQELGALDVRRMAQLCEASLERRELIYGGTLHGVAQPNAPGDRLLRRAAKILIPDEVWESLDPNRSLLLAPQGILHFLPFHALIADDGARLLDRAIISYAPTLQVWQTLASRKPPVTDQGRRALIVGIQDFGSRAPELKYALNEARSVGQILGAGVQVMLGTAARRDVLLALSSSGGLERHSVLHFATHAVFDADHPLASRVILADGALAVPELFRLRLDADLLTLSGCETALSTLSPGDELLGLREALLVAGARSLLLSLWPVDDASTAHLMHSFYRHLLGDGNADGEALRQWPRTRVASSLAHAQREMAAAGGSAYHWAPFMLIG